MRNAIFLLRFANVCGKGFFTSVAGESTIKVFMFISTNNKVTSGIIN